MKKLLNLLLFLLIGNYCYSQDSIKLPEKPWVELIEMDAQYKKGLLKNLNLQTSIKVFDKLNINLLGNYTLTDSIEVANAIRKLNLLTETLEIKFTSLVESNFRIIFLDSIKRDRKTGHILGGGNFKNSKSVYEMYIYNSINNEDLKLVHQHSLELKIARWLVKGYFKKRNNSENQFSVFSLNQPHKYYNHNLNIGDQEIISEVYKNGFRKRLKIAKEQFKGISNKVKKKISSDRSNALWWVRNPIAVMFLPFLILILLSLFLIGKINVILSKKIKSDLLKFTLIALFSFVVLYFLIVFYYQFYQFLKIPESHRSFRIWSIDIAFSLVLIFPFLYIFRFIEFKIKKTNHNLFIKTGLVFLSTGLIPFISLALIFIINTYSIPNIQEGYYTLSKMFLFLMSVALFRALISYFIFKERNLITENENKLSRLKELKAKAELKSLQSKINPHFLYNSLNSIAGLAHSDADKTEKMALSLSDLFKYTINRKDKSTSTLKDELEMVQNYLEIEQIRFGNRLEFTFNVDESLLNEEIPRFLIQPLIENAVKHGIYKKEGKGIIKLNIQKTANSFEIHVLDNGPNFTEGLISGLGLKTVSDLLRLTYGENASLNWQNTPEKSITISINNNL